METRVAVLGIIVPTLMYVLAAMRSVNKLLKKDAVLLLNGNAEQGERSYRNILVKKKISLKLKWKNLKNKLYYTLKKML